VPLASPATAAIRRDLAGMHGHDCILLVEPVRPVSEMFTRAIRSFGFEVVSARTGREALAVANRVRFNLLLLHGQLRDIPGLDVVRTLRDRGVDVPFIVMTVRDSDTIAAEAITLGATHVLAEPIGLTQLRTAIMRTVDGPAPERAELRPEPRPEPRLDSRSETRPELRIPLRPATAAPSHATALPDPHTASERWCNFVIALMTCEHDLKTTAAWAKRAGVSRSVIRECCRQVHIAPQTARDFGRILGAITRSGPRWVPEAVLDVADTRTLTKFHAHSGFGHGRNPRTPSIEEYLDHQSWIPQDNPALLILRMVLLGGREERQIANWK
jgi:CheY-like chemotaxis protein